MDVFDAIQIARKTIFDTGAIERDERQHKMVPKPTSLDHDAAELAEAYNILATLHERINLKVSKK